MCEDNPLAKRQQEVLYWASEGLAVKQIAEVLELSDKAIENYLAAARKRLGAKTTAHAVAICIQNKYFRDVINKK